MESSELRRRLLRGMVIPAHPLALTAQRKLDERRQVALTRYYMDAGSGGIAVGVHTTQFEIRDAEHALYSPVLALAADAMRDRDVLRIAGVCGDTPQALREAETAAAFGYHAALVSLGALRQEPPQRLAAHIAAVAEILPVFGFYLQPAVGGRVLPFEFWRAFAEIPNVVAIKIAPFNRYQTLDVVRAIAGSGRAGEIALYTGNDDNIVADLITEFEFGGVKLRIAGGLLGQWAVWTRAAVEMLRRLHPGMLTLGAQLTDANAAIFDVANQFHGCIPGINEILRRQGLLAGRWCLNPGEDLSPGQAEELDRVCNAYPHLADDTFVQENLDRWLR